jgi:hypothetical protein
VGCHECGDEPLGSGTTEFVSLCNGTSDSQGCNLHHDWKGVHINSKGVLLPHPVHTLFSVI